MEAVVISELNTAVATHEGMSGKHNEDTPGLFAWKMNGKTLYLGVVADGVGGQVAGELASRAAVTALEQYFAAQENAHDPAYHLARAVQAANLAVYETSQSQADYQGMGTTMSVAAVFDGRLYTAQVGDSRVYLLRDGRLRQLSLDHTWAREAVEAGLLTKEQARVHPNRNVINRFLGGQPDVDVDQRLVLEPGPAPPEELLNQGLPLQPGDTILIGSDGLSDMIDDAAIEQTLLARFHQLDTAAAELVDKANRAGGKDNISVVLIQIPGGRPPVAAAPHTPEGRRAEGEGRRLGLPLIFVSGLLILLALAGVGAFLLLNGGQRNPAATPSPSPALSQTATQPAATATLENPATAAIRDPDGSPAATAATPSADGTAVTVPALLPTLQPSPTRTPTRTARPPTPTNTATPAPPPSDTPGSAPPPTNDNNDPPPPTARP